MTTRNMKAEARQKIKNKKAGRPDWWPVRLPPGVNVYPKGYYHLAYGGGPLPTGVEMAEHFKQDEMIREKVRKKLEWKKKRYGSKQHKHHKQHKQHKQTRK